MRDRWPVFFAMTVSSLAVLATVVTAGLALSQGAEPAAFGLGLAGMLAASLGMLAIIRWMLDAGERRAPAHPSIRPESFDDNVVVFDPTRARRKNRRAL